MPQPSPRVTPAGRLWLRERIPTDARPIAHSAAEMGISRPPASRWWARYQAEGVEGLRDRPSVLRHSSRRLARRLEHRIAPLRRTRTWGPDRPGPRAGRLHRAPRAGPPRAQPGALAGPAHRPGDAPLRARRPRGAHPRRRHDAGPDSIGLGAIERWGGAWGRHHRVGRRAGGDELLPSARDDHAWVAPTEILAAERATTCAACWGQAVAFWTTPGVPAHRVLPDNRAGYGSYDVAPARPRPPPPTGAPTTFRATARSSAPTGASWMRGPTSAATSPTPPAPTRCRAGRTPTIPVAPTGRSVASPPRAGHQSRRTVPLAAPGGVATGSSSAYPGGAAHVPGSEPGSEVAHDPEAHPYDPRALRPRAAAPVPRPPMPTRAALSHRRGAPGAPAPDW